MPLNIEGGNKSYLTSYPLKVSSCFSTRQEGLGSSCSLNGLTTSLRNISRYPSQWTKCTDKITTNLGRLKSYSNNSKKNETLSGLKTKQQGQGDHFVNFAVKEEQQFTNQINCEISKLLELGHLEMKVQKSTTVYMLSATKDREENSCDCSDIRRNYLTRTESLESTSSDLLVDFNLYDDSTQRKYQSKEITMKTEQANINKEIRENSEVAPVDYIAGVTETMKFVPNEFRPKPPNLIGFGKYETFSVPDTEENKSWPCGMPKLNKRSQTNGQTATKHYSFEVALDSSSSFEEKISRIIERYMKNKNVECKCVETGKDVEHISSYENINGSSDINILQENDSRVPCFCCRKSNNLQQSERSRCNSSDKSAKLDRYSKFAAGLSSRKCVRECKCTQTKSNKEMRTVQSFSCNTQVNDVKNDLKGNVKGFSFEVALKELPKMASLEKTFQCKCGCKCMEEPKVCMTDMKLQTEDCSCEHKEAQTTPCLKNCYTSSDKLSTSLSSETITSVSESLKTCLCCIDAAATTRHLNNLRKKLSEQAYPFCRQCYPQTQRRSCGTNCLCNMRHVCNCYTYVKTKTLNEIKQTINDLNQLDYQYCTCLHADRSSSRYCKYCKCKLKSSSKHRNGLAWIGFENGTDLEERKKNKYKKKLHLGEIKIKIPVSYKKKQRNWCKELKKKALCNLQECLLKNRPDFVEGAEDRRRKIHESKIQREELSDYKKMLFLKKFQEDCERNG